MKTKEKIITGLFCAIILCLYVISNSYKRIENSANKLYNVYLNGEKLGVINDKEQLYDLIDNKQDSIKKKYNVNNVYPPSGLEIVESFSYDEELSDIDSIYRRIEDSKEFTVFGYEVKVSESDEHKEYSVYVLDKEVFNESVEKFILAFIDAEKLKQYMTNSQGNLEDVKIVYNDMKIVEKITFNEKYISVNEKIYENSDELAKDLLFGFNHSDKNYIVKQGDTIESISDDNKLNPQEFLIANPKFSSKDSLLAIGDTVNVTLIDPELSFAYKVSEIKEVEQPYSKEVVRDNSKPSNYSEITQAGVKGLTLQYQDFDVVNGESSGLVIVESRTIREPVTEITTKGKKIVYTPTSPELGGGVDNYVDTGSGWRWPTITPNTVTSEFKWRWGRMHNGMDIFAKAGSNIYAANDGRVVAAVTGCPNNGSYPNKCGGGYGNHVIIDHGNNVYTIYAHLLQKLTVSNGQTINRGQVIGYLGNSGQSKGYHLHFGFSIGYPGRGTYRNPRELFR